MLTFTLVVFVLLHTVNCKHVIISAPQQALLGSTLNVSATLYDGDNIASKGSYSFTWKDGAGHTKEFDTADPISNWSLTYSKNNTKLGRHRLEVSVSAKYIVWIPVAESEVVITLVDTLSGSLELIQDDKVRPQDFVSTQETVNHSISLRQADLDFLMSHNYYINTFWFENCTYLGMSHTFDYEAIYSVPNQYYNIEALVVASPFPLPDPTTSTTTTTTTTTSTTTTSTTTTTTTTTKPPTTTSTSTTPAPTSSSPTTTSSTTPTTNTTKNIPNSFRSKRDLNQTMHANARLLGINLAAAVQQELRRNNSKTNSSVALLNPLGVRRLSLIPAAAPSYNCIDGNVVAHDTNNTYGYFQRRVVSKTPISGFATSGKNWLQHWEVLNLQITCKGSAPFELCIQYFNAPYNATGNETCINYDKYDTCEFIFARYFADSKTILFFIRNEVSETVNQVTINIYEAKRQSQLSVVVVPITCTLVAVCLVIFGVAYYMQSRNRFNVEVADFNFGDTQSVDMEYKTFQQRLIDSIRDAWPWARWRRYSQSSTDLMTEQPSNSGNFGGNVGDVDSNLRYNTFN